MTQSSNAAEAALRDLVLKDPAVILDDPAVMKALVAANDSANQSNIVDLRGIAMERLENRLDRLEDTHRSVIAAAYDNLAGTNQIHRAIVSLLDPVEFEGFLENLKDKVAEHLRVDYVRLVLETKQQAPDAGLAKFGEVLCPAPEGFIAEYLGQSVSRRNRKVTLRQVTPNQDMVYGEATSWIGSEACLQLDFGTGTLPGMLCLGAEDPHQFSPAQGVDLLTFFSSVLERAVRRWLA